MSPFRNRSRLRLVGKIPDRDIVAFELAKVMNRHLSQVEALGFSREEAIQVFRAALRQSDESMWWILAEMAVNRKPSQPGNGPADRIE